MRKTIALTTVFILLLLLCSCGRYKYHSHTAPRDLPKEFSFTLNATGPVALQNASPKTPGIEEVLCQYGGWDVMGSLYDFTESAIGMARGALEKQNIKVDATGDKKLELSVFNATCKRGFTATASLRVRTSSGMIKEYYGLETYGTAYQNTVGFEGAMLRCVEQMLKDKEIVDYLAK